MNGRISTELRPRTGLSPEEELALRLGLLDGGERFALLLWRLPEGVPFDRVDLKSGPTDYIQCAGGLDGRFTCEVRHLADDGIYRQDVIGRAGGAERRASKRIRWGASESRVRDNEVLSLAEVVELFNAYLVDEAIPAAYVCRALAL